MSVLGDNIFQQGEDLFNEGLDTLKEIGELAKDLGIDIKELSPEELEKFQRKVLDQKREFATEKALEALKRPGVFIPILAVGALAFFMLRN